MHTILIVEDDAGIVRPLSLYAEKEGYRVEVCHDGIRALDVFREIKPDLVILDINLPGKSGIEVCEDIRRESEVPIIVLSARDSEKDKLALFELGADDYVAKPFSARELLARIAAVIKRTESRKKPRPSKMLTIGDIEIDTKAFVVRKGAEEIRLTKTEFSILEYCAKNMQNVIKRESIMKDVMGYDNYIYDRTIDTHMKNIRKKLGEGIDIETVRGVGYRIHVHELPV